MGLFQKNSTQNPEGNQNNNLPDYVDTLLEQADLDSVPELGPQIPSKKSEYGINDAINLMRKLPQENSQLVVSVVKETLSSANIDVDEVISDAHNKITGFEQRLDTLDSEINDLETLIDQKRKEISEIEANLEETQSVQNLLQSCSNTKQTPAKQVVQQTAQVSQVELHEHEEDANDLSQQPHVKVG